MSRLTGKNKAKKRSKSRVKSLNSYKLYQKKMLSKIRLFDDPILKEICDVVDIIKDKEDVILISKQMKKVLGCSEDGVGLAASQIGYRLKIIAVKENSDSYTTEIMINPEVISNGEEEKEGYEGCLSYPGVTAKVSRYQEITVKYINEELKEVEKKFEGLRAIVIQHEIDHTVGICKVGEEYNKGE